MPAVTDLSPEQVRDVIMARQTVELEPDAPVVEAHDWAYTGVRLFMREVRNHPKLGSVIAIPPDYIKTGTVIYFNRECRIAGTRRTIYVLFKEATS